MPVQWKVAVVERDDRLARTVAAGLRDEGYQVRLAAGVDDGMDLVHEWNPDLVVLDSDGPQLLARFRDASGAALIGVSARGRVSDVVAGLRAGADDYVVKPVALAELSARIHAVLRRSRGSGAEEMQVDDLVIEVGAGIARRGERQLELTAIEFRLLTAFARQTGKLLSQGQLLDSVWPVGQAPDSNSIEVHIGRVRRKLEAGGERRLLHTVRGMGYVLKP